MFVGHVGVNVTDLDRSITFYRRVFGLDLAQVPDPADPHRYARLTRNGELVLTLWPQSEGSFRSDTPGLHHLAFEVATPAEVEQARAVLEELGARFAYDGVVPHRHGAESGGLFFFDPDGTRLEISTDHAPTTAPAPSGTAPTCGFF
jgi:catechol 2,3-dioxygenase-like lactoylglutathione lyase family enzyme